jgi:RNA polymerase sigma-70 factor (ECF subfamily)
MATLNLAAPGSAYHLVCSVNRGVNQPLFDEDYLTALRDGDPEAENFLISHFSRPVQQKLRARLRSPELVEDAFQETFLRVIRYFRSSQTLDNPASLPGFVHRVCHNVSLELLRSHTRQGQIPENAPDTADSSPGPDAQLAAGQRVALVGRVMGEMNEKDRQLLHRVFLDEEDKDRVCVEFDVDRNYLRVLLHRARVRFRAVLTQSTPQRREPLRNSARSGGK